MTTRRLRLLERAFPGRGAYDTAVSRALLEAVGAGRAPESLRLYLPGPVLAFSQKDRHRPGFARAAAAARARGFQPVLRLTGGRAAVFHEQTLAFGWCVPIEDPRRGIHERFDGIAERLRAALAGLSLDVRLGEVPGEYCPGAHSLNLGGRRKVVGVGQRVVQRAAHVGGVVVVRDAARARDVLEPVYAALDYPLAPETVGCLADADPALTLERVRSALVAAFASDFAIEPGDFEPELLARAEALAARQEVSTTAADAPYRTSGKVLETS